LGVNVSGKRLTYKATDPKVNNDNAQAEGAG